jgi:hypothetical protein
MNPCCPNAACWIISIFFMRRHLDYWLYSFLSSLFAEQLICRNDTREITIRSYSLGELAIVDKHGEVFATLRAKGIKAIKVVASDGSKANGEVRGVRKRVVFAIVCAAATATGLIVYLAPGKERRIPSAAQSAAPATMRSAAPLPRQTIPGDRKRITAAVPALKSEPERLLAAFAEPRRPFEPGGKTPTDAEFTAILREPLKIADDDFTEAIDLKRIVTRIKADMRRYLAAGGSVQLHCRRWNYRRIRQAPHGAPGCRNSGVQPCKGRSRQSAFLNARRCLHRILGKAQRRTSQPRYQNRTIKRRLNRAIAGAELVV